MTITIRNPIKQLFLISSITGIFFIVILSMNMSHHENLEAKIIHENELMSSVSISSSNTSPVKLKEPEPEKRVRLLCMILTSPNNTDKSAIHVKATWARRCDVFYFVSTKENATLPAIAFKATNESRNILWGKTKFGFQHAYDNYFDKADWFLKADDDTYVIVENLKNLLESFNTSDPVYFGCKYKTIVKQGYMSGGAGYVLSREALERFINKALTDPSGKLCRKDDGGMEDVEMGKCLENVNVTAADSRDSSMRPRFFGLNPEFIIPPWSKWNYWYWNNQFYSAEAGLEDCCSNVTIAFHYMRPAQMYLFEFLIYRLKIFKKKHNVD